MFGSTNSNSEGERAELNSTALGESDLGTESKLSYDTNNHEMFQQWASVFENVRGFDVNKPWLVVIYRYNSDDHTVLYSLTHCDENQTVCVEPAKTTFTYQAEHSLIWDVSSTTVNKDKESNSYSNNNELVEKCVIISYLF